MRLKFLRWYLISGPDFDEIPELGVGYRQRYTDEQLFSVLAVSQWLVQLIT